MTISVGDKLPEATLSTMGEFAPEGIELSSKLNGRKVVVFGLPGAFTSTCSTAHLPSFMSNAKAFAEKGVDEIICVSVNDAYVVKAWDQQTGASESGVTLLGDPSAAFTKAIGMNFSVPAIGFHDRAVRYAMLVDDGVVTHIQLEEDPRACSLTTGDTLIDQI